VQPEAVIAVGVVINTTARGFSHVTPQSGMMLPLYHCDLQRHEGVNNLPTIDTRQRGGREKGLVTIE